MIENWHNVIKILIKRDTSLLLYIQMTDSFQSQHKVPSLQQQGHLPDDQVNGANIYPSIQEGGGPPPPAATVSTLPAAGRASISSCSLAHRWQICKVVEKSQTQCSDLVFFLEEIL